MSDLPSSGSNSNPNNNRPAGNNNHRRHNNQRRRPEDASANPPIQTEGSGPRRRHGRNHNNRPRGPQENNQRPPTGSKPQPQHHNPGPQGNNSEKVYEKYLNLLDQHLIARRKYHDLFYRADPGQKNKLERNFYNTLNDIRDFESRLAPGARELFEKRNNGLKQDNIYTTNHELPLIGENPPPVAEWNDPHFLQTQKSADYSKDKEESVGTVEDYLSYKNLA